MDMDEKKNKEGVSVKEIEGFARKHRFLVVCVLSLVLAYAFSWVFFSGWSPLFAAVGGILGLVWTDKIESFIEKVAAFCAKQEDTTQMVLGGVAALVSLFLPMVAFFILGLCGGKALRRSAEEKLVTKTQETEEKPE